MQEHLKFYIDGQWVAPAAPRTLDVINPSTEQAIARISLGSAADVDAAVKAARRAFETFSQTSRQERVALLEKVLAVYQRRHDEIAQADLAGDGGADVAVPGGAGGGGRGHLMQTLQVLKDFEFEKTQGTTAIVHEPIGVCRPDHAVELADQPDHLQGRPGAGGRLHDGAEAVRDRAAQRASCSPRCCTRPGVPRRRVQPGQRRRAHGRRGAVAHPGRRHGVVHRLDPRRHRGGQGRGRYGQARDAGTGRQVRQHRPRRCRPGSRRRPAACRHASPTPASRCNAPTRMFVPRALHAARRRGGQRPRARRLKSATAMADGDAHRAGRQPRCSSTRSRA